MAEVLCSDKNQNDSETNPGRKKCALKRSPNWRADEVQALCEYVKEHKAKLFGLGQIKGRKGINAAKKKHWEEAAAIINTQFGANRHWSQVRKKWKDLSYFFRNSEKDDATSAIINEVPAEVDKQVTKEFPLSDASLTFTDSNSHSSVETNYSTASDILMSFSTSEQNQSVRDIMAKPDTDCVSAARTFNSACMQQKFSATVLERDANNSNEEVQENFPVSNLTERQFCKQPCKFPEGSLSYSIKNPSPVSLSTMSDYERSRLRIEEDKLAVQRRVLECLRDISFGVRRIGLNYPRLRRRRRTGSCISSCKWQRRKRNRSDSSERDY